MSSAFFSPFFISQLHKTLHTSLHPLGSLFWKHIIKFFPDFQEQTDLPLKQSLIHLTLQAISSPAAPLKRKKKNSTKTKSTKGQSSYWCVSNQEPPAVPQTQPHQKPLKTAPVT